MTTCKECGKILLENAKFCIKCGSSNQEETNQKNEDNGNEQSDLELCNSCYYPLRDGASFCVSCGDPVSKSEPDLEEQVDKSSAKTKEEPEVKNPVPEAKEPEYPKKEPDHYKEEKLEQVESADNRAEESRSKKSVEPKKNASKRKDEVKNYDNWSYETGEKVAAAADQADILPIGSGVIGRITFSKPTVSNTVVIKGRLQCHECNKLSLISLEVNRGWGSISEPVVCACGKAAKTGEYWQASDDSIFVWAEISGETVDTYNYPLSIEIHKINIQ